MIIIPKMDHSYAMPNTQLLDIFSYNVLFFMLNHHLTPKLKLLGSEHAIYVIPSNRLKEQKLCYMELWERQKSKPIE